MDIETSLDTTTIITEHELKYEPFETSDIVLIIDVFIYGETVEYRVYAHKAVLASQCTWFANVFSIDKQLKELKMPRSFTERIINNVVIAKTVPKLLSLFFDTLYSVVDKCFWCLGVQQKRDLLMAGIGSFIVMIFYVDFKTLLNAAEQYFIHDHVSDFKVYSILSLVVCHEFKMNKLKDYVIDNITAGLKANKGNYELIVDSYKQYIDLVPQDCIFKILKSVLN